MLGFVSLRVGGIAFAMVTLAFAQAGSVLVFKNPHGWTGGEEGLGADYTKLPAWTIGIVNTKHLYWIALAYAAVVFFVVHWAVDSSPGHVWQAIRENELRVQVLGMRPYGYKLMSFVLGSFLATAGGVVYLLLLGGATPEVTHRQLHADHPRDGGARRQRDALGRDARRDPLHVGEPAARRTPRRPTPSRPSRASCARRCSSRCSCSACSSSSSSSSCRAGSCESTACSARARSTDSRRHCSDEHRMGLDR